MSLETLRQAVVATLDAATPKQVTCAAHGGRFDLNELKRVSAKAPALFVAVLGFGDLKESHGEYEAVVSWAAFVVTRDAPRVHRDKAAVALVDALALIVPDNTWGTDACLNTPQNVRGDNLFNSTVDKAGVAMWAVSWRQSMRFAQAMTEEALASLDLFEIFDAKYPVADDAPVAEDNVTLPQD